MTDTAVATTTVDRPPIVVLRQRLEDRKGELRAALPSDIAPDQFIRAVITSATINPDILACSWQSVWLSCMRACRDGLLPDGVEGALVPFKSTANWIPMYQGLLRRFRRSGSFKWVTANVVRQGEEFRHYIDEQGEHFCHVPGEIFEAPIVKIYALATTKDGGFFATVLPIAEANKIRNMSRATREDAPWKVWPEEMYKKTALRRLTKVLPSARDLVPDDDIDVIDSPATAPALIQAAGDRPRAAGPAAALEQFAGNGENKASPRSSTSPETHAATGGGSGAQKQGDATESSVPQRSSAADQNSATAADVSTAYERGKQAKADGMQRKAVPGEYRDAAATALAAAWLKGFDGAPL